MKKVYLFCSSGMSTGVLAKRMESILEDKDMNIELKAFPYPEINEIVTAEHPDCILLGPQAGYLYDDVKETYGDKSAVGVIDADKYRTLDGEAVLNQAMTLIKEKNN